MAAALGFAIYTLMGLMERNVGVEGGSDRDVTASGACSPAPGVLEMSSKWNKNSRKLLKFRSCLWAWHGDTLLFLARAPSHMSSRGNSVSALLTFAAPYDSGSCLYLWGLSV